MPVVPGIFFCFALAYVCMKSSSKSFLFPFQYHKSDTNTYSKLSSLPSELGFLSRVYFFKSNLVVLTACDIKGAKFMNFITICFQYFLYGMIIFRIIVAYVDLPPSVAQFITYSNNIYSNIILYFEIVFNCFYFLILSICFVFSRVKDYLPVSMWKLMKIAIFLHPLSIFVTNIILPVINNDMFHEWKTDHNEFYYIYTTLMLIYKYFDFHVLLFIVWILSTQDVQSSPAPSEEILEKYLTT